MTSPVTVRPRARLDLLDQFFYFGEQATVELAERYIAAVEESCRQLVKHPHMGKLYDSGIARLQGMRRFPVTGFEKHLIFYLPQEHGIDVIRVLHGARDIGSLFAEEEA
jgi:toxin ParE1/3/4